MREDLLRPWWTAVTLWRELFYRALYANTEELRMFRQIWPETFWFEVTS